jgi:hypothetical protein
MRWGAYDSRYGHSTLKQHLVKPAVHILRNCWVMTQLPIPFITITSSRRSQRGSPSALHILHVHCSMKPTIFLVHPLSSSNFKHVCGEQLEASEQRLVHRRGRGPATMTRATIVFLIIRVLPGPPRRMRTPSGRRSGRKTKTTPTPTTTAAATTTMMAALTVALTVVPRPTRSKSMMTMSLYASGQWKDYHTIDNEDFTKIKYCRFSRFIWLSLKSIRPCTIMHWIFFNEWLIKN